MTCFNTFLDEPLDYLEIISRTDNIMIFLHLIKKEEEWSRLQNRFKNRLMIGNNKQIYEVN
jgi:hypothetical protein